MEEVTLGSFLGFWVFLGFFVGFLIFFRVVEVKKPSMETRWRDFIRDWKTGFFKRVEVCFCRPIGGV